MRDPNNFFTSDDTGTVLNTSHAGFIDLEKANALIREALGPKVTGLNLKGKDGWCMGQFPITADTHSATLFCVKEIEK